MTSTYQHGSSGYWPKFADADVAIVLSDNLVYELHSRILRARIAWFYHELKDEIAAKLAIAPHQESRQILWQVDLDLYSTNIAQGLLVINPLDAEGKPTKSRMRNEIHASFPQLSLHYDNLLRAVYQQPLNLHIQVSIPAATNAAIGLLSVADSLGGTRCVAQPIEQALVSRGQHLFHAISLSPCHWAELALRLQSEFLYAESVCHLVGQFNGLSRTAIFQEMDPSIINLVYAKANELLRFKEKVELSVMGHYPPFLARPEPETANVGPGSVTTRLKGVATRATTYAQDIFSWMALNLFRHYVGQHFVGSQGRFAPDGGFRFYMRLAEGDEAYLDHEDVERFCGGSTGYPLSSKGRTQFEERLQGIKEHVKPYVRPLLENKCALDVERFQTPYLTCSALRGEDFPWLVARQRPPPMNPHALGVRPPPSGFPPLSAQEAYILNLRKAQAEGQQAQQAAMLRAQQMANTQFPVAAPEARHGHAEANRDQTRPGSIQQDSSADVSQAEQGGRESRSDGSSIPFRNLKVGKKRKDQPSFVKDVEQLGKKRRLEAEARKAEWSREDSGKQSDKITEQQAKSSKDSDEGDDEEDESQESGESKE